MSWKHFTHGEILTADDANTLMDQGRIVVADAAELFLVAGQPGMVAYRLDNGIEYDYNGTAWIPRDTGWIKLTAFATGWTATPGYAPEIRRRDKTVFVRGRATRDSAPGAGAQILTIPDGFRPSAGTPLAAQVAVGPSTVIFQLFTFGTDIRAESTTAPLASGHVAPLVSSWILG
jgi:hypothetical protein